MSYHISDINLETHPKGEGVEYRWYRIITERFQYRSTTCIIRHSRLPAGNALWFCQIYFLFLSFLFFRRQGFRMIIFDRQAGPLQNFNRSHVMIIGRSVSFSDPARGAPQTPQNPPPPRKIKYFVHAFQNPRNIFEFQLLKTDYLMQWPIYLHELPTDYI